MKKRLLTIIGVVLMAVALFTVIHFIWSDLYIAEFDADDAEIVVWGEVTLETGLLVDPDFHAYLTLIPVGGNLFFEPFVKIFGLGITAQRAGYTAFAVLIAAMLVFALWACLNSWDLAMISCGLILMCTTATETIRATFWAHSVYYGVSIFFILMCFGSLALYLRGKRVLGGILLFISALLGSINGSAILLYTVLPLAAALFLEPMMNQERPSEDFLKMPFLLICAAIVCGTVLNKVICAGIQSIHAGHYMVFCRSSQWVENLRLLPEKWLCLFFELPQSSVPVSIKMTLRLGGALVLSVLPFFSFAVLKETDSRMTRIVILYHWFLCAALLFFFVFGAISGGARRLIPLWFSCLIVDCLTMVWMLRKKRLLQTVGAASACLTMLFAALAAFTVVNSPADLSIWYDDSSIYNILETHGLTHGYSMDYWYTNSITVLSDSRISVLGVDVKDDGFTIADHQNKGSWYKEVPTDGKTFLICKEYVVDENPWLKDEAVEVLRSTQYTPHNGETDGFYILVYDHDIIAEKLQ